MKVKVTKVASKKQDKNNIVQFTNKSQNDVVIPDELNINKALEIDKKIDDRVNNKFNKISKQMSLFQQIPQDMYLKKEEQNIVRVDYIKYEENLKEKQKIDKLRMQRDMLRRKGIFRWNLIDLFIMLKVVLFYEKLKKNTTIIKTETKYITYDTKSKSPIEDVISQAEKLGENKEFSDLYSYYKQLPSPEDGSKINWNVSYKDNKGKNISQTFSMERNKNTGVIEYYKENHEFNKKARINTFVEFQEEMKKAMKEKELNSIQRTAPVNEKTKDISMNKEVDKVKNIKREMNLFMAIPAAAYVTKKDIDQLNQMPTSEFDMFRFKLINNPEYNPNTTISEKEFNNLKNNLTPPKDGNGIQWDIGYKDQNGKEVKQVLGIERNGSDFKYYMTQPNSEIKMYMNKEQFESQIVKSSQNKVLSQAGLKKEPEVNRSDLISMKSNKVEQEAR